MQQLPWHFVAHYFNDHNLYHAKRANKASKFDKWKQYNPLYPYNRINNQPSINNQKDNTDGNGYSNVDHVIDVYNIENVFSHCVMIITLKFFEPFIIRLSVYELYIRIT